MRAVKGEGAAAAKVKSPGEHYVTVGDLDKDTAQNIQFSRSEPTVGANEGHFAEVGADCSLWSPLMSSGNARHNTLRRLPVRPHRLGLSR